MDAIRNMKRSAKPTDDLARIEMQLEDKTEAFEAQQRVVKDLLEKYPHHHAMIRERIRDLLQIQQKHHEECVTAIESVLHKFWCGAAIESVLHKF